MIYCVIDTTHITAATAISQGATWTMGMSSFILGWDLASSGIYRYSQEVLLNVQAETGKILTICFFGETSRCPYERLVNYNSLVYNEDNLRYIYITA